MGMCWFEFEFFLVSYENCAETAPRGPQPRRRDALPDYDLPGAAEGSEMGNPTSSGPQAEGHPDNSFRGLLARPAALY